MEDNNTKFKIGDRVRYLSNDYEPQVKLGSICVVSSTNVGVDSKGFYVKFSDYDYSLYARYYEIELVESAPAPLPTGVNTVGGVVEPKVTQNENLAYFDVDETLIKWDEAGARSADFYGEKKKFFKYQKHIDFLKSLKARGYYIIVHSGNGWQWAKNVVDALQLNEFVDEIKSKPGKVIDDKDYSDWMPTRIYLKD